MSRSVIPKNDYVYDAWVANFITHLSGNLAQVGLVAADMDALDTAYGEFNTSYQSFVAAHLAARSSTSQKLTKRAATDAVLRPLIRRINNHPGMTDALRSLLGLTPQHVLDTPVPITELTPSVFLETAVGQVDVHWGPNPQNENQNGKPLGVKGANIYRKKAGESNFQMLGFATRSPFLDEVSGEASDYTYVVRYRGTKPTELSKPSVAQTIAARGDLAA